MQNIGKEQDGLITDLLKTFPEYGLGDLQYEILIKNFKIDNRD